MAAVLTSFVVGQPVGRIPSPTSADVACDEAGVVPYGVPNRANFLQKFDRRTAFVGAWELH